MAKIISIVAIQPYASGDWHDKPVKWSVEGPGGEVQHFSTKREAQRYATIRRRSTTFAEAGTRYVMGD